MSRIFIIIFYLATSFTLYTACSSGQERGIDTNNDDFILQCDTLLGAYPDIVVKKLDSAIAVSRFNEERYSLLLLKSKAKLFMSKYYWIAYQTIMQDTVMRRKCIRFCRM